MVLASCERASICLSTVSFDLQTAREKFWELQRVGKRKACEMCSSPIHLGVFFPESQTCQTCHSLKARRNTVIWRFDARWRLWGYGQAEQKWPIPSTKHLLYNQLWTPAGTVLMYSRSGHCTNPHTSEFDEFSFSLVVSHLNSTTVCALQSHFSVWQVFALLPLTSCELACFSAEKM